MGLCVRLPITLSHVCDTTTHLAVGHEGVPRVQVVEYGAEARDQLLIVVGDCDCVCVCG